MTWNNKKIGIDGLTLVGDISVENAVDMLNGGTIKVVYSHNSQTEQV